MQGLTRVINPETARGIGWCTRSTGEYAAIAPDNDPIAAEYRTVLANTFTHLKAISLDDPTASPIGFPYSIGTHNPEGESTSPVTVTAFEYHFWIQSMGYVWDLEPGFTAPQTAVFQALRDFMYRIIVGCLGPSGSGNYCFSDAAVFRYNISADVIADFIPKRASSFFFTWGEVWAGTQGHYGLPNGTCVNSLEGFYTYTGPGYVNAGNPGGGYTNQSYWANLLPAIAYAVDHEATGAAASWARIVGASNFSRLMSGDGGVNGGFDAMPIYSILPRSHP